MTFIHCENINGVLVPRVFEEYTPTEENPLPEKKSDMVTGSIEINKHDYNIKFNCYTGTNKDGSTDGVIEHKRYFHFDNAGNIVGDSYAMINGVTQDVPTKLSDNITGALHTTNETRKGAKYSGADGSIDGSIK